MTLIAPKHPINFEPTPLQHKMFQELERNDKTVVLFGGSGMSGKSWGGCSWLVLQAMRYPDTVWGLTRARLIVLKKTTGITLNRVLKAFGLIEGIHYTHDHSVNIITFWNNSKIILFDCYQYHVDENFERLSSLELSGCLIDEASEISSKAFNVIQSRIRFNHIKYNLTPKILIVTNPTQNFIKTTIYDRYVDGTLEDNVSVVLGLPTDNPYCDQSYIDNLQRLDTITKARMLYGDWNYADNSESLYDREKLINIFYNHDFINTDYKKYLTCDIAMMGNDSTCMCLWEGYNCYEIKVFKHLTTPQIVSKIKDLMLAHQIPIHQVVIDCVGVGAGVHQLLLGSVGFIANSSPKNPIYKSLKDECYYTFAELVNSDKIKISYNGLKDEIVQELESHIKYNYDKDQKTQVLPKDLVKKSIGRSPDISDALTMRCYFENKEQGFAFGFA